MALAKLTFRVYACGVVCVCVCVYACGVVCVCDCVCVCVCMNLSVIE